MEKNKVFLDTSIIIAALLSQRGGSFYILTQLKNDYYFQINEFVVEELLKTLDTKFASRSKEMKSNLFFLLGLAKVEILPNIPRAKLGFLDKVINKDDAPILACAISYSNWLLTLDKDFLKEKIIEFAAQYNLQISTPGGFLCILRQESDKNGQRLRT